MAKKTKMKVEDVKVQKPQVEQHECFSIIKNGNNWNIACGNNYISKMTFATVEEAKNYIDSKPWELIVNTTCYIYELSQKNKTNKK